MNGLLYSHGQGDMNAQELRDIVLVHSMKGQFSFADLLQLPEDEQIPTLLNGAALQPSLSGASSDSAAGSQGSGTLGLIDRDLDACAEKSVMHTIKGTLLPTSIKLPESASPRAIDSSNTNNISDAGNGSRTLLIAFIAGAGLLCLGLVAACICCFRLGAVKKSTASNTQNIVLTQPFGGSTTASSMPYKTEGSQSSQHGNLMTPEYYAYQNQLAAPQISGSGYGVNSVSSMGQSPTGTNSQHHIGYQQHRAAENSSQSGRSSHPFVEAGPGGPFGITPLGTSEKQLAPDESGAPSLEPGKPHIQIASINQSLWTKT